MHGMKPCKNTTKLIYWYVQKLFSVLLKLFAAQGKLIKNLFTVKLLFCSCPFSSICMAARLRNGIHCPRRPAWMPVVLFIRPNQLPRREIYFYNY